MWKANKMCLWITTFLHIPVYWLLSQMRTFTWGEETRLVSSREQNLDCLLPKTLLLVHFPGLAYHVPTLSRTQTFPCSSYNQSPGNAECGQSSATLWSSGKEEQRWAYTSLHLKVLNESSVAKGVHFWNLLQCDPRGTWSKWFYYPILPSSSAWHSYYLAGLS